jgi:hypothetical protein
MHRGPPPPAHLGQPARLTLCSPRGRRVVAAHKQVAAHKLALHALLPPAAQNAVDAVVAHLGMCVCGVKLGSEQMYLAAACLTMVLVKLHTATVKTQSQHRRSPCVHMDACGR